jgi:glycosyltransferase involved in cell wall biosynthesis
MRGGPLTVQPTAAKALENGAAHTISDHSIPEAHLKRSLESQPVSVVLCTFNGGKFLRAQLESLAAQTIPPTELIIGDDGSADDTLEIARAFAANSRFPVIIHENRERRGYRQNFLDTAKYASGKYIAFCDQDDVWRPQKLEACLNALLDPYVVLATHSYFIVDAELQPLPARSNYAPSTQGPGYGEHLPLRLGFTQVFRSSLITAFDVDHRPNDPLNTDLPMAHDQWVSFAADLVGTTRFLPERLAFYRQHHSNVYGVGSQPRRLSLRELIYRNGSVDELRLAGEIAEGKAMMAETASIAALSAIPGAAENLKRGSRYWRKLAISYAMRSSIRNGDNLGSRAAKWAMALGSGAYDFGLAHTVKQCGKDLIAGVLFPGSAE